jgi:hypothetical protein
MATDHWQSSRPGPDRRSHLYFELGDSRRVPASESLRDHAQSVCLQAGVKQGPLLDACMLGDAAAERFAGAVPRSSLGRPPASSRRPPGTLHSCERSQNEGASPATSGPLIPVSLKYEA